LQIAPGLAVKKYHVQDTGLNYVIARRIGACLLWIFCFSWCLIFQNYTKYDAFCSWPWIIDGIGSTLNGEPKKYGFSPLTNIFMLILSLTSVLAMDSDNEAWKNIMIKISTAWWIINGVGFTLLPGLGETGLWKVANLNAESVFLFRVCGFICLANGTILGLLDMNVDVVRALGHGFVVLTAGLVVPFYVNEKYFGTSDLSKRNEKYGMVQERHRYMLMGSTILTVLITILTVHSHGSHASRCGRVDEIGIYIVSIILHTTHQVPGMVTISRYIH
jgi:hypothetical protein